MRKSLVVVVLALFAALVVACAKSDKAASGGTAACPPAPACPACPATVAPSALAATVAKGPLPAGVIAPSVDGSKATSAAGAGQSGSPNPNPDGNAQLPGEPVDPGLRPTQDPSHVPQAPLPATHEPTEVPALPPALEAHLARIGTGNGLQMTIQADVAAVMPAALLRTLGTQWLAAIGKLAPPGELPADGSCAVDVLAGVTAFTFFLRDDGEEQVLVLVDSATGLPALVDCLATFLGDEMPPDAARQAEAGTVAFDDDFVAASVGPGTLAFGSPGMVTEARGARGGRSLADDPTLARARALAGEGPAYVAFWVAGRNDDAELPLRGGASLKVGTRIGAVGSFVFSGFKGTMEMVGEIGEMLDELAGARQELFGQLGSMLPPAAVAELRGLADAAMDLRMVVQGPMVSLDVWLPETASAGGMLGALSAALPLLFLGGMEKGEESRPEVVEMVAPPPAP
jgi:hypothetical protein